MKTFDEINKITKRHEREIAAVNSYSVDNDSWKLRWLDRRVAYLLSMANEAETAQETHRLAGYMELLAEVLLDLQIRHLKTRTRSWVYHHRGVVTLLRSLEDIILEVQATMAKGLGI